MKLPKEGWNKIRAAMDGWRGEIHHCCGKQYEQLRYLRFMSAEDHRGSGHKKCFNVENYPIQDQIENLRFWQNTLYIDDYIWFVLKGYV